MAENEDTWKRQLQDLGAFIRHQRQLANMSLRQLADLTKVSNPYLSQIERGLHEPSVRVLKAVSEALDLSAEVLLAQAGMIDRATGEIEDGASMTRRVEAAINADDRLSADQRQALLTVYRSYVDASGAT